MVISKNVKVIPSECFSNCSALTQVTIPEGVEKIKEFAFWGCRNLTKVTLPKRLDESGISDDAFENCPLDKDSQEAVNEKVKAALTAEWELKVGESQEYDFTLGIKAIGPGKTIVTVYTDKTKTKVVSKITFTITGKTQETTLESDSKAVKTVISGNGIYKLSDSAAVLSKPKNKNITKLSIPATVSANGKNIKCYRSLLMPARVLKS